MKKLLLGFVRFYQLVISPFMPGVCRFRPTCSDYMQEAVAAHGSLKGGWMGLKRLLRCHPFAASKFDPVPPCETHKKPLC